MKLSYYDDTDTLYIEFSEGEAAGGVREIDEDILFDLDEKGRIKGITIEHASKNINLEDIKESIIEDKH